LALGAGGRPLATFSAKKTQNVLKKAILDFGHLTQISNFKLLYAAPVEVLNNTRYI
jgi:hypothetical protein